MKVKDFSASQVPSHRCVSSLTGRVVLHGQEATGSKLLVQSTARRPKRVPRGQHGLRFFLYNGKGHRTVLPKSGCSVLILKG